MNRDIKIYSFSQPIKAQKAFTLIELIIVVMIISLVGFLVFSEAVKESKKPEKLEPLTLPLTLKRTFGSNQEIEFFCVDDCSDCYIAKGADIIPYKGAVDLGKNLEVYVVDEDNKLAQVEDFGRVKDHKLCLRYKLYSNGSSEQMILSNDKGIYYLPTYFGEPIEVEDMEEARELWIKSKYDLKDSGNYY